MTDDTVEDLQARVEQLEAELAEARQALERATTRRSEPAEDAEWGQFNPG